MEDNKQNDRLIKQVDSLFRRTYSPSYSWMDCLSAFGSIPGLRAFWPMSSVDYQGGAVDHSNLGKRLTITGGVTFSYTGLTQYAIFNGATGYFTRPDAAGMDILGNETFIAASKRGMTVGGWFYFDGLGNADACIAKDDNAAQRSFVISKSAGNVITFLVNGATTVGAGVATAANWCFLVGRFTPSTEIALFTNGVKEINVAAIPATITNSSAAFTIGSLAGGINFLAGRSTLCFYCAMSLADSYVLSLYHASRALFGK